MESVFDTVYLWRKGNPQAWSDAFFGSWMQYDPGPSVRLTLLLKGFHGEEPAMPRALTDRIDVVHVDDQGFDLTAYKALALKASDKVFLFLNSHSRFEAPDWHARLTMAWQKIGGRGLLGASGSWETIPDSNRFPNVHIRTTGFVVSARDYLNAAGALDTRKNCLLFEAGEESLTRFFFKHDLPVVIANAQGDVFTWEDWPKSGTFRLGDQEQLLISDNRTRHYRFGSAGKRRSLSNASWGEKADVTRLSLLERSKRLLWEKHFNYGRKAPFLNRNISRPS